MVVEYAVEHATQRRQNVDVHIGICEYVTHGLLEGALAVGVSLSDLSRWLEGGPEKGGK